MLKVALIGVGGFGYCHLLSFKKLAKDKKIQLVAASDINVKYRKEMKQKHVRYYTDYKDMLENHPELDYITISTPIHTHVEIASYCLEKEFHILMEKPPAILPEEWMRLKILQEKNQRICALNYTMTADPAFLELILLIQSHRLGRIEKIVGYGLNKRMYQYFASPWIGKLWLKDTLLRDGTINNSLSHLLNNMVQLLKADTNAPLKSVQAELYHANPITGDDTSCLRAITSDERVLLFYGTLCHSKQEPVQIEVYGTKGNALWQYPCYLSINKCESKTYIDTDNRTDLVHENWYSHFTKGTPLYSPLESCEDTVRISDAAFRSSETIETISAEYIIERNENGKKGITLPSIKELFTRAAEKNALFSEINCPWAIPKKKVLL